MQVSMAGHADQTPNLAWANKNSFPAQTNKPMPLHPVAVQLLHGGGS
jgi:hypothetical protein